MTSVNRNHKISSGFTMIEMVVVIIVLGIIASVAFSRIVRSDASNGVIIRDQIIALARSSQQMALGRSGVLLTLKPNAAGDELDITTEDDSGVRQSYNLPLRNVGLTGDVNNTNSCGSVGGETALSLTAPLIVAFTELGDLFEGGVSGAVGYPEEVSTAVRICLNNDPVFSVCISPAGFAYVGDCEL